MIPKRFDPYFDWLKILLALTCLGVSAYSIWRQGEFKHDFLAPFIVVLFFAYNGYLFIGSVCSFCGYQVVSLAHLAKSKRPSVNVDMLHRYTRELLNNTSPEQDILRKCFSKLHQPDCNVRDLQFEIVRVLSLIVVHLDTSEQCAAIRKPLLKQFSRLLRKYSDSNAACYRRSLAGTTAPSTMQPMSVRSISCSNAPFPVYGRLQLTASLHDDSE